MLPIEPYDFSQPWLCYLERLKMNFDMHSETIDTPEKKVSALLVAIGSNAYEVLKHLTVPVKPTDRSYDQLMDLLNAYFDSRPKVLAERYKFQKEMKTVLKANTDAIRSLKTKFDTRYFSL